MIPISNSAKRRSMSLRKTRSFIGGWHDPEADPGMKIMLTCPNPTCGKKLPALERECPRCRTDLSLLCDYVDHLGDGLARAEALTRAGELGEAVWAYLSVLEVDPDNATARRQVGQVVTAVRQFDEMTPGRRWLRKVRRQARFRAWLHSLGGEDGAGWFGVA